jgi:hypothetical protein
MNFEEYSQASKDCTNRVNQLLQQAHQVRHFATKPLKSKPEPWQIAYRFLQLLSQHITPTDHQLMLLNIQLLLDVLGPWWR